MEIGENGLNVVQPFWAIDCELNSRIGGSVHANAWHNLNQMGKGLHLLHIPGDKHL
jgi:hypothetical protein